MECKKEKKHNWKPSKRIYFKYLPEGKGRKWHDWNMSYRMFQKIICFPPHIVGLSFIHTCLHAYIHTSSLSISGSESSLNKHVGRSSVNLNKTIVTHTIPNITHRVVFLILYGSLIFLSSFVMSFPLAMCKYPCLVRWYPFNSELRQMHNDSRCKSEKDQKSNK